MPHIYAVGDCAGYWQLAHTAFREGEVAAENAMGHDAVVDARAVPRPIYTDPEIAGVGLTEAQAREEHGDEVAVGVFPWVANARAVMQNETVGWVKSIHETRYGELLGLVMVGPHVTDLIEAGVVAIDAEATVETVADGIAAHPTLSEAIKEAGLVALGRPIHLPPKRKAPAQGLRMRSRVEAMSIVNRRNAVIGWADLDAGKRVAAKKAKRVGRAPDGGKGRGQEEGGQGGRRGRRGRRRRVRLLEGEAPRQRPTTTASPPRRSAPARSAPTRDPTTGRPSRRRVRS